LRVLFIYKYLTLGGVESVLRARLKGLPTWGVEAYAWFLSDGPGRVLFRDLDERVWVGPPEGIGSSLQRVPFDLVISIDTDEAFPYMASLAPQTCLLLESHSPYKENIEYLRFLSGSNAAAILVPSRHQARLVEKRVAHRIPIRVIPNPMGERFLDKPVHFPQPPPRPVVAWIGRQDHLKNWNAYLEILRTLTRMRCHVEGWMVGRGSGAGYELRLLRRAKRLHVLARLRWFSALPHEAMPHLFDAVRDSGGVVISTSRNETFGLAIAEAMARGCAVVVPDQGPFPEFVEHGSNGLRYRSGSTAQAASMVAKFLRDEPFRARCGARARDSILQKHAPEYALRLLAEELNSIAVPRDAFAGSESSVG